MFTDFSPLFWFWLAILFLIFFGCNAQNPAAPVLQQQVRNMTPAQWEAFSRFSARCNLTVINTPSRAGTAGQMTIAFSTTQDCIRDVLKVAGVDDDD